MTGVEGDAQFRGNVRNIQCGLYVGVRFSFIRMR